MPNAAPLLRDVRDVQEARASPSRCRAAAPSPGPSPSSPDRSRPRPSAGRTRAAAAAAAPPRCSRPAMLLDRVIHEPSRPARPGTDRRARPMPGRWTPPARMRQQRSHLTPAARSIVMRGIGLARGLDVGRRRPQLDLRDDEQHRQLLRVLLQQRQLVRWSPTARPSPAASCRSACSSAAARFRASTCSRSATSAFQRSTSAGRPATSSSGGVGKHAPCAPIPRARPGGSATARRR